MRYTTLLDMQGINQLSGGAVGFRVTAHEPMFTEPNLQPRIAFSVDGRVAELAQPDVARLTRELLAWLDQHPTD